MNKALVPNGDTTNLTITEGVINGSLSGAPFTMPLNGSVKCGSMFGFGSGRIYTATFIGDFRATWTNNAFPNGTWEGAQAGGPLKGSGTFKAAKTK